MFRRPMIVALTALLATGCATTVAPPAPPTAQEEISTTERGGVRRKAVEVRATVEAVDQKARKVTLLGFDGTRETLTVGPEVKNLAQVRKGDEVVVTYYMAAAFEVLAPGEEASPDSVAAGLASAKPGEMPSAIEVTQAAMVVDVVKLDSHARTAVIRNQKGETVTIDIRNPAVFEKVQVGDRVQILITLGTAIDVQRAGQP